jgi:hypothetical protein
MLASGPRLPRGSFGLVVPLTGLPLPVILFSALVPLAPPDGTPKLFILIAFLERATAALTILLVTVAYVPLSPVIVQLIALRSLLAALVALLPTLHGALVILLVLLWLTTLRLGTLLSTPIALLIELTLVHRSLLFVVSDSEKLGFELRTMPTSYVTMCAKGMPRSRPSSDRQKPWRNTSFEAAHAGTPARAPHTGNSYRERSDRAGRHRRFRGRHKLGTALAPSKYEPWVKTEIAEAT